LLVAEPSHIKYC